MRLAENYSRSGAGRSHRGSAEIAQFIPALYVLFMVALLPLLNVGAVFMAAAVQYLATNDFASRASTQSDFPSALNTMTAGAYQFKSSGLANFITMSPQGGFTGCGDDLYVLTTNIASGLVTSSSADMPLTQPVQTGINIYEISVKSSYSVSPLIDLSAVPILGDVPALGKPVTLSFTANRPLEHPGGFQATTSGGTNSNGTVALFRRVVTGSDTMAAANASTWRTPTIYQMIQAAGETIVSVNVVMVNANSYNLTPTGLAVQPGEKIWIDTQAIGVWNIWPGTSPNIDANGYSNSALFPKPYLYYSPTSTIGSLLGQLGASGTPFYLGDDKYNLPTPGSGALGLICNDYKENIASQYDDNTGTQMVRVIITQ